MNKKTRKRMQNQSPVRPETEKVQPKAKLSFSIWFDRKVAKGEMRDWQSEAVRIFFKKQGLSETEYQDTYNEVFKNF